jgi:elongation factor Ts
MVTIEQVKELRDQTGVSIMQCRKALEEAGGDMEKAIMIMKKKSSEVAAKKGDREALQGIIVIKNSGEKTVMLELNCETDFVAQNSDFTLLAEAIADKTLSNGVQEAETTASELINPVIQKIGENIKLGRIEMTEGGIVGSYIHNGKTGVLVKLSGGTKELAKDIAMHIAAMRPEYITKDAVPADMIEKAKEMFKEEVEKSDKPEDIKAKMLEGKLATYFKEQTLMDQAFIKNPDMTIEKLLTGAGAVFTGYTLYTIA